MENTSFSEAVLASLQLVFSLFFAATKVNEQRFSLSIRLIGVGVYHKMADKKY